MSVMTPRRTINDPESTGARPRRWRRWLAGTLAVAVVVGLVWIVVFSPVLSARSVRVEGMHRLTTAQVVDAAQVPTGTPLVRVSRGAIARRVEQLPQVLSARVELSFPSTVVIEVTERVAAAYGLAAHGGYTYVDATGKTFDNMAAAPTGLPLLSPAADVAADPVTLAAMAQIAAALPASVSRLVRSIAATAAMTSTCSCATDGPWCGVAVTATPTRSASCRRCCAARLTSST